MFRRDSALPIRLKQMRQSADFTQAEVTRQLGFKNVGRYYNYEAGTRMPGVKTLSEFAQLFGVSIETLLQGYFVEVVPYLYDFLKANHDNLYYRGRRVTATGMANLILR